MALAILDRRTPGVAAWLYSRCFAAGASDRTYYVTIIRAPYYYPTSGSTNGGGRRAFSIEVLFYLFVYIYIPNGFSIFEYYGRYSKSTLRP